MGKTKLRTLNYMFYPPRTTAPSCFNIPTLENATFKLKRQYTHTFLKFMSNGVCK